MSNKHAYLFDGIPLKEMGEAELLIQIMRHAENLGFADLMLEAITIASICHRGQLRANRSTLPRDTYLTHPLRNTLRLIRAGIVDKNILIATVLHDVVEDATDVIVGWTHWEPVEQLSEFENKNRARRAALSYLRGSFGIWATRLVELVSNPLEEVRAPYEERVPNYTRHLKSVMVDPEAALVKITDLIDNGAGLHHNADSMPIKAYRHLTNKYVLALPIALEALRTEEVKALFTSVSGYQKIEKNLIDGIERLMDAQVELSSRS